MAQKQQSDKSVMKTQAPTHHHQAILDLIDEQGYASAAEQFKVIDDCGLIAINSIHQSDTETYRLASDLTLYSAPSVRKHLDINKVTAPYSASSNETLHKNLSIATEIVNAITDMNILTCTHPNMNGASLYEYQSLAGRITRARTALTEHYDAVIQYSESDSKQTNYHVSKIANAIKKDPQGNCLEYSFVALDLLHEQSPFINAELYTITHGDHLFMVIDRDRASCTDDYQTWGNNAVVVDAWSNAVFSANDIPQHLTAHESHTVSFVKPYYGHDQEVTLKIDPSTTQKFNVVLPVNLNYHRLSARLFSPAPHHPDKAHAALTPTSPRHD
tara:strand:- start:901 stop:1890 length:990 start_codon:yes stop_codon:yes gene_type:complete